MVPKGGSLGEPTLKSRKSFKFYSDSEKSFRRSRVLRNPCMERTRPYLTLRKSKGGKKMGGGKFGQEAHGLNQTENFWDPAYLNIWAGPKNEKNIECWKKVHFPKKIFPAKDHISGGRESVTGRVKNER